MVFAHLCWRASFCQPNYAPEKEGKSDRGNTGGQASGAEGREGASRPASVRDSRPARHAGRDPGRPDSGAQGHAGELQGARLGWPVPSGGGRPLSFTDGPDRSPAAGPRMTRTPFTPGSVPARATRLGARHTVQRPKQMQLTMK